MYEVKDVTIIIPVYVTSQEGLVWLDECLASAVSQGCAVVVVNDGSPVDISSIVGRYSCTYIQRAHVGVSSARNAGAMVATSKLIIPLDCDDKFATGAIGKMVSAWDGSVPVYPDVRKFGLEDVPHYNLLDFECEHILTHVGFSSVNVLHSREQWKSIGGWDESLDFYEDGEYNARLFARYCGKHLPEPLVEYRIHADQRTKQYKKRSADYARKILEMIRRLDMACKTCGNKRKISSFAATTTAASSAIKPSPATIEQLPGESNGLVLVQYIGGVGQGKHYYRGVKTNNPYKVKNGELLYVDASDARMPEETMNISMFVRIIKKPVSIPVQPVAPVQAPQASLEAPTTVSDQAVVRLARKDVEQKVPIIDEAVGELPDIATMSVKEIYNMDALPAEVARKLLAIEQNGRARSKVLRFLQGLVNGS